MSSAIPTVPSPALPSFAASAPKPAAVYPDTPHTAGVVAERVPRRSAFVPDKPQTPEQVQTPEHSPAPVHHHAASPPPSTALSPEALSTTDISYVRSLMGTLPAQKMEEILLKTGVPIPVNLGPNIDTTA